MSNNSVSLHRVLTAKPEKVFRAFTDANAFLSWLAPYGMFAEIEEMEVKVGLLAANIWKLNKTDL